MWLGWMSGINILCTSASHGGQYYLQIANIIHFYTDLPFTDGKILQAVVKYSESIDLYPTAKCLGNRALAYLKLESYGIAIADSEEALVLDPNYTKVVVLTVYLFFMYLHH